MGVVAGIVEVLCGDLEVAADTLERARVAGLALERGEEVRGVDAVDLAFLRRVDEHLEALERLQHHEVPMRPCQRAEKRRVGRIGNEGSGRT